MEGGCLKILILSFYYTPDLSAGSFRATALVGALLNSLPPNSQIDVVTTLPNRYSSFSVDAPAIENHLGLHVRRIALSAHQSGMVDQSKAFLTFYRQAIKHVEGRDYDLVFGTSSRLMTAVMAAWVAKKKKAFLYLDIRDIFVDTVKDVLPRHLVLAIKPFLSWLENWAVKRADKVNLVSRGFEEYFKTRYPRQQFSFFTNGIDAEFLNSTRETAQYSSQNLGVVSVLYAGNFGEGQGLHAILPALAKKLYGRVVFSVIGDGGLKEALRRALAEAGVENVVLLPPIKRDRLIQEYLKADVLFLHLNDYDAFKKVLPSKVFEYAAMGKPIWAGVSGYPAEFIKEEIENAAVFEPCDVDDAVAAFQRLELKNMVRLDFIRKFSRVNIMQAMATDISTLAQKGH
jgi:glycosyltransferase involved in cell wall biosynthesis